MEVKVGDLVQSIEDPTRIREISQVDNFPPFDIWLDYVGDDDGAGFPCSPEQFVAEWIILPPITPDIIVDPTTGANHEPS